MKRGKKRSSKHAVKHKEQKINSIGGWLIPILILMIYSAISAGYMLIQRIIAILTNRALFGVYVSVFFLIIYSIAIWMTIVYIFLKKKSARGMFVISAIFGILFLIWFYIIGQIIYNLNPAYIIWSQGLITVLFNASFLIVIYFYLRKSKRVKKTLVK